MLPHSTILTPPNTIKLGTPVKPILKADLICEFKSYYQIRIENKIRKKLPQIRAGCVSGVTFFQLYFLFVFDSNSKYT